MQLGSQNANTAPVITWCLIEIVQDPALFKALRAEVQHVLEVDPRTGKRTLDYSKLANLPLLASVYAESMRLHVSVNITRLVEQDMKFDGFKLKKGALVQSPSGLGHLEHAHWSKPNHPAEQFWAERFIVHEEVKDNAGNTKTVPKFSASSHAGYFYPYGKYNQFKLSIFKTDANSNSGGGASICAGRNFAKLEIMTSVALFIINFDIEFIEYTHHDGTKSDRGPLDDPWWCGTAAMPPDRDLKIRWKRI